MEKIKSFTVNHNTLNPGIYISRTDRNAVTYDLRITKPNVDFMPISAMHTMEHLGATYLRNSQIGNSVIYFGPMGCATGFYFVVFDNITHEQVIDLLQKTFSFIAEYSDEIPGCDKEECGNYRSHNLEQAKNISAGYLKTIEGYTTDRLVYPQ